MRNSFSAVPACWLPLSPRLRPPPRWLLPQRTHARFAHHKREGVGSKEYGVSVDVSSFPCSASHDKMLSFRTYSLLLAPCSFLLLAPSRRERGEALSCFDERLGRFRVPRQRAFVNGATRRFVSARSVRPLPLGVRWPRQRIGNGVGGMDAANGTNGTDNLQTSKHRTFPPNPEPSLRLRATPSRDTIARGP